MIDKVEQTKDNLRNLHDEMENDKEDMTRQMDLMTKAVKQLQDQKMRRDEYDDRRIAAHVARAAEDL